MKKLVFSLVILALSFVSVESVQADSFCFDFKKNLGKGMLDYHGSDLWALQKALETEGFLPAGTSDGTPGVTKYLFGSKTAAAVSGLQEKYFNDILGPAGLSRGNGYVGAGTRAKLNALYGCAGKPAVVPTIPNPTAQVPTSKPLALTVPGGGEVWVINSKQWLSWRYQGGLPSGFSVGLSKIGSPSLSVPLVQAAAPQTRSASVNIPGLTLSALGAYELKICALGTILCDAVPVTVATSTAANLIVADLQWSPAEPVLNDDKDIVFEVIIKNAGSDKMSVPNGTAIHLWKDAYAAVRVGSMEIAEGFTLAPNATTSVKGIRLNPGVYLNRDITSKTLVAYIDGTYQVPESNEEDNSFSKAVTIIQYPKKPLVCGTKGDVNLDTFLSKPDLDALDAYLAVPPAPLSSAARTAADVNGDAKVDGSDRFEIAGILDGGRKIFTGCASELFSVEITSPKGGEVWQASTTATVSWLFTGPIDTALVDIHLINAAGLVIPMATSTPNDGSEMVPLSHTLVPGTYRMEIIVKKGTAVARDASDAYFAVNPPPRPNVPPQIQDKNGPTSVVAGRSGLWTLTALDPDGTYVDVSIDWGDERRENFRLQASAAGYAAVGQYPHTYASFGVYTASFSIRDAKGEEAKITHTVNVSQPPAERSRPCSTLGDVNSDAYISLVDRDLASGFASGSSVPTSLQKEAADVNKDGTVTAADATAIAEYVNGVAASLPGCTQVFRGSTEALASVLEGVRSILLELQKIIGR